MTIHAASLPVMAHGWTTPVLLAMLVIMLHTLVPGFALVLRGFLVLLAHCARALPWFGWSHLQRWKLAVQIGQCSSLLRQSITQPLIASPERLAHLHYA